jgi:hypothetical protein
MHRDEASSQRATNLSKQSEERSPELACSSGNLFAAMKLARNAAALRVECRIGSGYGVL